MKLEGRQQPLTVDIGESDRHGHTPLATDELITEGLVVVEDIEVFKYVGRGQGQA